MSRDSFVARAFAAAADAKIDDLVLVPSVAVSVLPATVTTIFFEAGMVSR